MKSTTTRANNKTGKTRRFRGISADAERLDVCRQHLWQVLTGRRQSRSLLSRYQQLKRHTQKTA